MYINLLSRTLACGLIAGAGLLAVAQSSEAAVRLKYDPAYGAPFNSPGDELSWFGVADVDDGSCTATGIVLNFIGPCANQFSFLSATVSLANVSAPTTALQTFTFTGGQVLTVTRSGLAENLWSQVVSTAFTAQQANASVSEALFNGQPAWFSLVFVGANAQLIWFENNPGPPPLVQLTALSGSYGACLFSGTGENNPPFAGGNTCGRSSGQGAPLVFTVVPEPEAYMMALASLGVLGVVGTVSRRRKSLR